MEGQSSPGQRFWDSARILSQDPFPHKVGSSEKVLSFWSAGRSRPRLLGRIGGRGDRYSTSRLVDRACGSAVACPHAERGSPRPWSAARVHLPESARPRGAHGLQPQIHAQGEPRRVRRPVPARTAPPACGHLGATTSPRSEVGDTALDDRRAVPHRHVGCETRDALGDPRPLQGHPDQGPGNPCLRVPAQAGRHDGPLHPDPLGGLSGQQPRAGPRHADRFPGGDSQGQSAGAPVSGDGLRGGPVSRRRRCRDAVERGVEPEGPEPHPVGRLVGGASTIPSGGTT